MAASNSSARMSPARGMPTAPDSRYSLARARKAANSANPNEPNGSSARQASSTVWAARPSPAASSAGSRLRRNSCRAATCMMLHLPVELKGKRVEGFGDLRIGNGQAQFPVGIELGGRNAKSGVVFDARLGNENRLVPTFQKRRLEVCECVGVSPNRFLQVQSDHVRQDSQHAQFRAQVLSECLERCQQILDGPG